MNQRKRVSWKMALLGFAVLICDACGDVEVAPIPYELVFHASNDRGDALRALEISVGETRIGETNEHGVLRASVSARDGQTYSLHAPCPPAHSPSEIPSHVAFRETKGLEGDSKVATLPVKIVCARQVMLTALLIHADGYEDLPVLIDGVAHGQTGPGGFSHIRLNLEPNTRFEVSLDTSSRTELRPQNPRQNMTTGSADSLFVFDPVFTAITTEKKRPRVRRRKNVIVADKKRPVKID